MPPKSTLLRRWEFILPEVAKPKLSADTLRYVADNLILELRDDRLWERRILPDYHPEQSKTEVAGWKTMGAGKETKPEGYIDILRIHLNPMPQMDIPVLLVALAETDYDEFRVRLETERRLEHLDALLEMNPAKRVFISEDKGYGTALKTYMRRAKGITEDEAKAALELSEIAHVWRLRPKTALDSEAELRKRLANVTANLTTAG